jgi:hypothetical protein
LHKDKIYYCAICTKSSKKSSSKINAKIKTDRREGSGSRKAGLGTDTNRIYHYENNI